ncbi:unnamed protein product [Allacma fusca]|uniref:Uncharacterized protein n=1 Tax=Allacma fusca TaxID=39272 RepID=A0A8J2JIZ8_9HEXA|nr:unnamed protein product [Allacma fusca]
MEHRFSFYADFFLEKLKNPSLFWLEITALWQQKFPNKESEQLIKYLVLNPENKVELVQMLVELKILKVMPITEFLTVLGQTGNELLAEIMSLDPDDPGRLGSISWEKIIYDLWEDLTGAVACEELSEVFTQGQVISKSEVKNISRTVGTNEQRMAKLMILLAQRTSTLEVLQKALYFLGTTSPQCVQVANKCTPCCSEQFDWIQHHRDVFIVRVRNIKEIARILHEKSILNSTDLERLEKLSSPQTKSKFVINTVQRRSGPGMQGLINACSQTDNDDLAIMMSLRPTDIRISWDALQLLQFGWKKIVENVNYELIMGYLISRNYLPYKDHMKLLSKSNEDKIREILKLAVGWEDFYEAFFHVLSLQRRYKDIFKMCYPMDFEEQKILLEVQDFLAMHMENISSVCERLADFEILTPSDVEYVAKMQTPLKKKMAIINILKNKGNGTVRRFLDVLWATYNRDCAEILAVNFRNFNMNLEEWMKLKSNWITIVSCIQWELVSPTLLNTGILDKREMQWIDKSAKNRQKIRKLLRLLPSKERGYRILLLALSQYDEFHTLLLSCQPMDAQLARRIQENEEFLMENTNRENFPELLDQLRQRNVLNELEVELIILYEDPIFELYNLLRGKTNDVIEDLIKSLQMTGNFDAAAILNVDLSTIKMTDTEWQDYQRMWLDSIESIKYLDNRKFFVSTGLISRIEDEYICTEPDNERQMRLLLQVLPYRQDALQGLVQIMTS